MGKKAKRLCDWKKGDIKDNFKAFSKIVAKPQYACEKCGRVADQKKWLHDAKRLKV